MKKYANSVIAAILAAVMLSACGNGEEASETAAATVSEETTTAEETREMTVEETTATTTQGTTAEETAVMTAAATTHETDMTEITGEDDAKTKLSDIIGNKFNTPDIMVNASRIDIPRSQFVELINDIQYCDDMYSFITGDYDTDFYYDYNKLEVVYENEIEYYKVDEDIATNFDEMFACARKCFSQSFISDEALEEEMFGSDYPEFVMIDGQLANLCVSPRWKRSSHLDYENAGVVAYSDTEATVWVAEDYALEFGYYDTNIFNMVRESETDMWKINSLKYLRWDMEND